MATERSLSHSPSAFGSFNVGVVSVSDLHVGAATGIDDPAAAQGSAHHHHGGGVSKVGSVGFMRQPGNQRPRTRSDSVHLAESDGVQEVEVEDEDSDDSPEADTTKRKGRSRRCLLPSSSWT